MNMLAISFLSATQGGERVVGRKGGGRRWQHTKDAVAANDDTAKVEQESFPSMFALRVHFARRRP